MKRTFKTQLFLSLISLIFFVFLSLIFTSSVKAFCVADAECPPYTSPNRCDGNNVTNDKYKGVCINNICSNDIDVPNFTHIENCACGCSSGSCNTCRSCNFETQYNQCCAAGLSQWVKRYQWSDGSGVCKYESGACNQSDAGCPGGRTCDFNRQFNSCCAVGKSQWVKEYKWSDGSGTCKWESGACDQTDAACNGPAPTPPPGTPPPPPPPPPPDPNCHINPSISCNKPAVTLSASPKPVDLNSPITFNISGDASTCQNNTFSGGVSNCGGAWFNPWDSKTCTSTTVANTYTWTHFWQVCIGALNNCSPVCSESLNFTVADFYNSRFISQKCPPADMYAGDIAPVSVTMKNTGYYAWTATGTKPFKLGSQNPPNNKTWGINRVLLPSPSPANIYTFNFNAAPITAGDYNFQWQMIQEGAGGAGWFGAKTTNCPVTVTYPPCPGGLGACASSANDDYLGYCSGDWQIAGSFYNLWCNWRTNGNRPYCYTCGSSAWIQATGDVHSNKGINAPGGP